MSTEEPEGLILTDSNIIRSFIPTHSIDKVIDRIKLQCKRQIASIAQQRHFEHVQPVPPGYMVDPFGVRVVIPHFPEEGREQHTQPEGDHRAPVAAAGPVGEGAVADPDVDGFQNKVERDPDEGEEYVWPGEHQAKHDPASYEKEQGCSLVSADHRSGLHAFDKVEACEEFRAPKYRGNDRREAQRGPEGIFERREHFGARVGPVLGAEIEQLEDPPDRGRGQEQANIFRRAALEQGSPGPPVHQPVNR